MLVAFERRGAELERLFADEERLISVITVSELLHGVHRSRGRRQIERRAFVEHVLELFDAVTIGEAVARIHAEISAELAEAGTPVAAHDLWIAATALTYRFGVATLDARDFERVPGLRVLAP